ncbi:MAG: HAMP domain-containing sensor histidine kinase [Lachnospiraceae bacterium]|nr:HAMP domain-containing sensor histidine kinase [Lachnospiraceae bacterium]
MEIWLWCLVGIMAVIIIALLIKLYMLQKAAGEIEEAFADRLETDTNILIDISCNDRYLRSLANSINIQLRKLRRERRRFQQGDRELKHAVANISHDLRTPLTAISAYLDLLDHLEKSKEAERYIEVIRNRTEVLKQLTEELFRYSVAASPEYDSSVESVAVNSVLEESILGFYAVFQEQKITPNIFITEKKVICKVNRVALSRIFSNLIQNAIKYSDGDLDITLTDSGKIVFANRASALSEVDVNRLFDRFYTVENAKKSTGLGLAISKILIEQMNGRISAEYEDEKLKIWIQLPVQ